MHKDFCIKCSDFDIFAPLFWGRTFMHTSLNMNKLFVLVFMALVSDCLSQGAVNSPFSRYGIGDLNTETPMHLRQMGGISTSNLDLYHLNFDNPASLGYLKATGFDFGLDMKNSRISDNINSSSQWSGNLAYLGLGFTLRNPVNELFSRDDYKFNWGMGFAVMPNSTVSYDISRLDSLVAGQPFLRSFEGEGGSYKVMWSNAVKYGDFSLGANLGWIFGNINYSRNIDFTREQAAYDNTFERSYSLSGFYSKFGLIYLGVLNEKEMKENSAVNAPKSITAGISYKPAIGFSTVSEVSEINSTVGGFITDTLFFATDLQGNGTLPSELAFGVTYTNGFKYAIGIDYRTTFWNTYRNDANPEDLSNTTRIAVGGFYRPDASDVTNILNRTSYRLGFYFEQDPRTIESESINTFGITIGAGLPLAWQRRFANLNLGLDFGKRSVQNILDENFIKITFGFTFNESDWFVKRKFN